MKRHVFVLGGSTTSKQWVKELSVRGSGLFIRTFFLKAIQRSRFNWNVEHFLQQNGPHPVFTSAGRGFNSTDPRRRWGGWRGLRRRERCEALSSLISFRKEKTRRGRLCRGDEKERRHCVHCDMQLKLKFMRPCFWLPACVRFLLLASVAEPSRPSSLWRSDESDQASSASTGPGPLIKNANVSCRAFDARPRRTKPAKVTKGLCNPLFGARRRETPSWEP